MKTELEELDGVLVIRNEAEGLKAVLDIATGEVIHMEYPDASIQRLKMFINKVYARYAMYVSTNSVNEY